MLFNSPGEEFECLNPEDGSGNMVHISLCEDTAELVLHWKDKGELFLLHA